MTRTPAAATMECIVTPITKRLVRPNQDPIVYVAGPMTGIPDFNFPAFDEGRDYVVGLEKYQVISPADVDREEKIDQLDLDIHNVPENIFQLCMRRDLEIVANAHAIFLLKGWEKSRGANNELFVANTCGVEVWIACYDVNGKLASHVVAPDQIDPPLLAGPPAISGTVVGETRMTDPSGGQKGAKLARFDLLPWDVLGELAEHYGKGALKYEDRNWQKGYAWSLNIAALGRHLAAFLSGEDTDPETGSSHIIAVAWHCFALRWFQLHDKGTDDRSPE